jgi:DNA-binding XRE family transcriptional regulator
MARSKASAKKAAPRRVERPRKKATEKPQGKAAPPRIQRGRRAPAPEWDETLKAYLAQIGGRVHEIRQMQGLTLAAVEEFTGIDYRQIIRIEQGEVNFTVQTAYRIARALGVETHELYIPRERSSIRAKTAAGDAS